MNDLFYKAFEDKFRGSRELIKSRLAVYLPFVKPLLVEYPNGKALDLGCGRGEWLELLAEHGYEPHGVDIDEGMLQDCHERGLQVHTSDAIEFLKSTPDASQCVVSGFHIAEHLPFDALKQLVIQAERVLVPGGLLILETPNPENISVGSNSFYLDPTHQRPIPPLLLNFIPEHYGFARSKILRLQESPQLHQNGQALELMSVLDGVSPDYSVVAQKKGPDELAQLTNTAFEQDYGITLHNLASRYQNQLAEKLNNSDVKSQLHQALSLVQTAQAQADQLNQQLAHAHTQEQQTKEQLQQALSLAQTAQAQADQLHQQLAHAHAKEQHLDQQLNWQVTQAQSQLQHAQAQLQQLEIESNKNINELNKKIDSVYKSYSWRITAPLRMTMKFLKRKK